MELKDTFTVEVPPQRLWEVLTDVERVAPCVPGFTLEEVDEPEYRGQMKVKVGAIVMRYDATIVFAERDDEARRAVLKVSGKERRGPGSVDATVTATLSGDEQRTTAEMATDVQVTGRIAQFGRGIIADVSSRLTERFVASLDRQLLGPDERPTTANGSGGPAGEESAEVAEPAPAAAAEPLDLAAVSVVPVLKRLGPPLVVLVVLALLWRRRAR